MALTCLSARRLPHGEDQKMHWESFLARRVSAVRWMGCGPIREGGVTPVLMGSMINGLTIVSHCSGNDNDGMLGKFGGV